MLLAGVEVASAKTQTTKSADVFPLSAGPAALPSQFVVGKCTLVTWVSICIQKVSDKKCLCYFCIKICC